MKKKVKATGYIFVGIIMVLTMMWFVVNFYISGTFLEGQWLIRKVVYAIAFGDIVFGIWLTKEGTTYLLRKRR